MSGSSRKLTSWLLQEQVGIVSSSAQLTRSPLKDRIRRADQNATRTEFLPRLRGQQLLEDVIFDFE